MKFALSVLLLTSLITAPAIAKPFHDSIPTAFHGTWADNAEDCADPSGVNTYLIDADSVDYCESNDYLVIGVEFMGTMTNGGNGSLFNCRFTRRLETFLMGESDIRFEIDGNDRNVLYRYATGDDGEPIASRSVRSIRCS